MTDSVLFYDTRKLGLGDRFFEAVMATAESIAKNPGRGHPFAAGTRKRRVEKFPFALIYKELPTRITVFAVAHFSRRPGYWMDRL